VLLVCCAPFLCSSYAIILTDRRGTVLTPLLRIRYALVSILGPKGGYPWFSLLSSVCPHPSHFVIQSSSHSTLYNLSS